jgi:hypothetical protein
MTSKPKTLDEVYAYLSDLKPHESVPLAYTLTPLSAISEPMDNMIITPVNDKLLNQILTLLEHMDEGETILNELQKKLNSFLDCVPKYVLDHVEKKVGIGNLPAK